MNQTSQNVHIQIRLPGSGELCTFPVDSNVRFSDVFRTLIGKGCFACPQGEPSIASVPSWATKEVHFTSYPDPLARAKAIYLYFEGSKSIMGHEGFLREYKSYQVTPEQEALWRAE